MADVSVTRQVAERIRTLRSQRGWSAQRLADACSQIAAGSLTRAKIAKIEAGIRKSITAEEIAVLAQALDMTPAQLIDIYSLVESASRNPPEVSAGTVADRDGAPPAGAVLVRSANSRLLGVHAAIHVEGAIGAQPSYVERDVDLSTDGIRSRLARAADRGGFVLLVGGSSVGKTRCAYEAVRKVLPDWWLFHPADPSEIEKFATVPRANTVLWLDELQRYLGGEYGLKVGLVRQLLRDVTPLALVGTMWPDLFSRYTTVPTSGVEDPYQEERKLLELAEVIYIADKFSTSEQIRAKSIAISDPRVRVALESHDYGLTQVIAAAPQLVSRYQNADAYAWAVITAVIDVERLGVRSPVTAELLRAAAPGYCDDRARATAPANWFEDSLAYATQTLHGAIAAVERAAAGTDMGDFGGYVVADYLVQYVSKLRQTSSIPAAAWDAYIRAITNPDDLLRLAESAHARLLYSYAEALYRRSAELGSRSAAVKLTDLLAEQGRNDEALLVMKAYVAAEDPTTGGRLADLLAEQGRIEEAVAVLRTRADVPDPETVGRQVGLLADLLAEQGHVEEAVAVLRARADASDPLAAKKLADLLADRGRVEELRARADAGDSAAAGRLADLLVEHGRIEEAMTWSRSSVNGGAIGAVSRLADLLTATGRTDEATSLVRFGLTADGSIAQPSAPRPANPPSGFEEFFRNDYRFLINGVMAAGANLDEAQDVVEEVMITMLRHWSEIKNPRVYARRAAMSNFIRQRSRDQQLLSRQVKFGHVTPETVQASELTAWEDRQWVVQMFQSLTAVQREVMAYTLDGLSIAEIAEMLGKTPESVRRYLHDARERLKRQLAHSGRTVKRAN